MATTAATTTTLTNSPATGGATPGASTGSSGSASAGGTPSTGAAGSNAPVRSSSGRVSVSISRSGANTSVSGPAEEDRFGWRELLIALGFGLLSGGTTLMNLAALVWFALWTGLKSKKPALSSLKALALVQFIPWILISFLSTMILPMLLMVANAGGSAGFFRWYFNMMLGTSAILTLIKDVAFILRSRHKLRTELRLRATGELGATRKSTPPALPVPASA